MEKIWLIIYSDRNIKRDLTLYLNKAARQRKASTIATTISEPKCGNMLWISLAGMTKSKGVLRSHIENRFNGRFVCTYVCYVFSLIRLYDNYVARALRI